MFYFKCRNIAWLFQSIAVVLIGALDSQSRAAMFKTIGCPRVDSVFSPAEVDKWLSGIPRDLMGKSKLSPRSVSAALKQLSHIHRVEP